MRNSPSEWEDGEEDATSLYRPPSPRRPTDSNVAREARGSDADIMLPAPHLTELAHPSWRVPIKCAINSWHR